MKKGRIIAQLKKKFSSGLKNPPLYFFGTTKSIRFIEILIIRREEPKPLDLALPQPRQQAGHRATNRQSF